jgi:hypothetical protein
MNWYEDVLSEGWTGYSLSSGELTRETGRGVLSLEGWPAFRVCGFRYFTPRKLLRESEVTLKPVAELTLDQQFDIASDQIDKSLQWKRARARYQGAFRASVLAENTSCLNCGSATNLEAAHALMSAAEWANEFDVRTAHDPIVGVALCSPCHRQFDAAPWRRDNDMFARIDRLSRVAVLHRIGSSASDFDLMMLLAERLVSQTEAWAFDFLGRGPPMAAGWHLSRFCMLWVLGERAYSSETPLYFARSGERVQRFAEVSPRWNVDQWELREAYQKAFAETVRRENRARSLEKGKLRTAASEPIRQMIIDVLRRTGAWMTLKDISAQTGVEVAKVKTELESSNAALVPRGIVESRIENRRKEYRRSQFPIES